MARSLDSHSIWAKPPQPVPAWACKDPGQEGSQFSKASPCSLNSRSNNLINRAAAVVQKRTPPSTFLRSTSHTSHATPPTFATLSEEESLFTGLRKGTPVRVASNLNAEQKRQRKEEGILCNRCNGTGYKGRVGTYELLRITRPISNAIKKQLSTQEIEEIAVSEGMLTLHKYAVKLIEQKITTVSELMKISNDVYS